MRIHQGEDQEGHFAFTVEQGTTFTVNVASNGFTAEINGLFWYISELEKFCEELTGVIDHKTAEAHLEVVSCFHLKVTKRDNRGYFTLQFDLCKPMRGDNAQLYVAVDTHTLMNFQNQLMVFTTSP